MRGGVVRSVAAVRTVDRAVGQRNPLLGLHAVLACVPEHAGSSGTAAGAASRRADAGGRLGGALDVGTAAAPARLVWRHRPGLGAGGAGRAPTVAELRAGTTGALRSCSRRAGSPGDLHAVATSALG